MSLGVSYFCFFYDRFWQLILNYINLHTHQLVSNNEITSIYNNRVGEQLFLEQFFSIGIHPYDVDLIDVDEAFKIMEHQVSHKNCLAIGECGLDKASKTNFENQKSLFEKQLQLALTYKKPVIIHCVKAFDELLEVTKPYRTHIPLIIHGFNKSEQLANDLIKNHFYLSVNPLIIKKTVFNFNTIPIEKLFLETDNKRYVSIESCYEQLALKLNVPLSLLLQKIKCNFETVFYATKK